MLRLMYAAGCQGELRNDNSQLYDDGFPPDNGKPIAYLRTMPHAQKMYDPKDDILKLRKLDYDVMAIVMVRDWYPMCKSQVAVKHTVTMFEAEQRARQGLNLIFHALHVCTVPYIVVTYAGLFMHPDELTCWLFNYLDLEHPMFTEEITDEDDKWWSPYQLEAALIR
jgi:hypothetical protein